MSQFHVYVVLICHRLGHAFLLSVLCCVDYYGGRFLEDADGDGSRGGEACPVRSVCQDNREEPKQCAVQFNGYVTIRRSSVQSLSIGGCLTMQ